MLWARLVVGCFWCTLEFFCRASVGVTSGCGSWNPCWFLLFHAEEPNPWGGFGCTLGILTDLVAMAGLFQGDSGAANFKKSMSILCVLIHSLGDLKGRAGRASTIASRLRRGTRGSGCKRTPYCRALRRWARRSLCRHTLSCTSTMCGGSTMRD